LFTKQLVLRVHLAIPEFGCDGVAPYTCSVVGNTRGFRTLLDPPETAVVQRINKDETSVRVTRNSSPIRAADITRKVDCRSRWCAGRAIRPWCVRTVVDQLPTAFLDQVTASCSMGFGGVRRRDEIFGFVIVLSKQRWLERKRLRRCSELAGNVTLWNTS